MSPADELIARARLRCRRHRSAPGLCRDCLLAELEAMILEEHPDLAAGDAFELVQEWARAALH